MRTVRLAILVGAASALCSAGPVPLLSLTLLPGSAISGAPGDTIGWGYSITNNSTDWVQTESLNADSFPGDLNPLSIFDLPEIAPGTTLTEPFSTTGFTSNCSALPCGLYQVKIPTTTAPETVTGTFDISAEFFGDSGETQDLGATPDLTAAYSAAVTPVTTSPEPGTLALLFTGFSALLLRTRKH